MSHLTKQIAAYRYVAGAVFLIGLAIIAVYVKSLEHDVAQTMAKVAVMEETNRIHFNTLLQVNQDLDQVIMENNKLQETVAQQEKMIAQLEQLQYGQ